jgi:hypothetical protein
MKGKDEENAHETCHTVRNEKVKTKKMQETQTLQHEMRNKEEKDEENVREVALPEKEKDAKKIQAPPREWRRKRTKRMRG